MSRFHKLKVAQVNRETADTVSVTFELPEGLRSHFQYKPGQYLTIRTHVNGELLNRSYSLCSCPTQDKNLTVAVKQVPDGRVSTYVNTQLQAGHELEVMEPLGNFVAETNAANANHYILFGAGSGITPMMSIIRTILKDEPNSRITLFYGNRNEDSVIFGQQLQELASANSERFKLVHIYSQPSGSQQYTGRIDRELALRLLREQTDLNFKNAEFYMCGPSGMMKSINEALQALIVPVHKIHREYFTAKEEGDKVSSGSVGSGTGEEELHPVNGENTTIKITYDGDEFEVEVSPKQTVLEAALDAGYDPPYSCMVAACCTCRAKVKSGKIEMEDREALTDDEIAEGYVLTCQSHPTTHGVVLNYDE